MIEDNQIDANTELEKSEVPVLFSIGNKEGKDRYFVPRLKDEFPELNDIKEFDSLNRYEIYFCWLVGSPHSPRNMAFASEIENEITQKKVIFESVEDVWGGKQRKIGDEIFERYQSGDLPEKLRAGIDRFKRFKPRQRYLAQLAIENMFMEMMSNLEKMKNEVQDIEGAKKYAELSKTTFDNIQKMLPRLEQGFGFRMNTDEDDLKQDSLVSRAKKKIMDNGMETYL